MSWTVNGNVLTGGNQPLQDSSWPEIQQARNIEHYPIGATAAGGTVLTRVSKVSLGAEGAKPLMLHFWCDETTRDILVALDDLAFSIIDPWSRTVSVHCKDVQAEIISNAAPAWDQLGARFHVWLHLIGR